MVEQQGSDGPSHEVSPEAVAVAAGRVYWRVEDCRWPSVHPTLPDDMAALLAPPIVVSAVPVTGGAASRK
jgi:hypothetical protein